MTFLFYLIFIAWISEAFFSGAETAFISVNFLKIVHLVEKKEKRAILVHNLLKKPDRLLITTLIGTNLSVVVSSACATAIFTELNPQYGAALTILIMTPISFVLCQLLPKTIFRYKANSIVLPISGFVSFSEKILLPFVNFFSFIAHTIAKVVNPVGVKKNPFLTKDEIKLLIKDISRDGILEPHEKDAIDQIFELTLTKAADVMVPLKSVVGIDLSESIDSIREKCRQYRFTRFPVFEAKILKGSINIFEIFYATADDASCVDWKEFIRPIVRIEHNESLDKVFSKMQPNRELMASVFKGEEMVGILTMEDLMEDVTAKMIYIKKIQ